MKTKKLLFLVITFIVMTIPGLQAQVPDFEWAVSCGGDSTILPYGLAVDPSGNQVYTGVFRGTVDFNPDPDVIANITSNGLDDIFILKLGPAGNYLWAAGMGDAGNDKGNGITTDASGNIYTTGCFIYSMDADPGPGVFMLTQTKQTAYVLKIAPDGNLLWAKQMGYPGDWGLAYGFAVTLDNDLNVISAGDFTGRIDFDPGPGTFNMTHSGGVYDGYIQKLDNAGNFIWARQLCGPSQEHYAALTADASGNIYAAGTYGGTADFNPDKKLKYNITAFGINDIFYQKLNADGAFVWAKHIGGTGNEFCYVIYYDPFGAGALYTTGQYYDPGDYDPGPGTLTFTSNGVCDAFLEKLDLNGNLVWAKHMGGASYDSGSGICTDAAGNVYLGGFFYLTTDFNPDPDASYYMTAEGADDFFIHKSDVNGNFIWAEHFGGVGYDGALALAMDAAGDIIIGGDFQETVDFNIDGDEVFELTATNETGRTFTAVKLSPSGGDDCPVPFNLAAGDINSSGATLSWTAPAGATGYAVRYREVGTEWIYMPEQAETSLVLSDLDAATAYEFQVRTTCVSNYSYSLGFITAGGCQDNYEPNETMTTAAPVPVNTDIFGLITQNDNDYFSFSTTNAAKNVTVTLTNLPEDYNLYLYKSNGTLLGSSTNVGLSNETIAYNTTKTGSYVVKVIGLNGAYDPANCYTLHVTTSGAKSAMANPLPDIENTSLSVYPNPAREILNIDFSSAVIGIAKLSVMNTGGQTVMQQEFRIAEGANHFTVPVSELNPGLYLIRISTDEAVMIRKLMITK